MHMGLAEKSIIVTGGGSGIGRAAAVMLAEEGAFVTIADRNAEGGRQTVAEIEAAGKGRAQFVSVDISDEQSVRSMVQATTSAYGRVDGAINSAGVPQRGKLMHELSAEEWDACHAVNLRGAFFCLREQVGAMVGRNGGSIVLISSNAAILGTSRCAEYCASKAGVMGLIRSAALDYVANGIRINGILPGGTLTPMIEFSLKQDPRLREVIATFPMKRLADPREVAAGAVWLVSDQASYVTGVGWSIDGGYAVP
jgi:2,5-dichloro-2,5-cyclohexadiene-1,4-diol dehydrogenase 1